MWCALDLKSEPGQMESGVLFTLPYREHCQFYLLLHWNATDWVYFSVFRWDAKGHWKNTIIFSSSGSCKPCFCNFLLCMICTGLPWCKNLWSFSLFSSYYFPWLYCVDFSVASLYSLFYVSCEFHRFLHRGWAICTCNASVCLKCAYSAYLRAIAVVLTTPERSI